MDAPRPKVNFFLKLKFLRNLLGICKHYGKLSLTVQKILHYTVMPFGLGNTPQTLFRLMDRAIPAHICIRVVV